MNFAAALRRELAERARLYAHAQRLPHCLSYGESPIPCFEPFHDGELHGNFFPASYKAIQSNPEWKRRLAKVHTLGKRSFPATDRGRWMELDTCTSSDALLMNIFCHPSVSKRNTLNQLFEIDKLALRFGYRARVPLVNGGSDRTEVDLKTGHVLIEAKLTESDFQTCSKRTLDAYRDFQEVFDCRRLPQTADRYISYQLIRNVLAAHSLKCSFRVIVDARRPDLIDAWYAVMSCVDPIELRTELKISTWQEIASMLPAKLQNFLALKYGIDGGGSLAPNLALAGDAGSNCAQSIQV